tara:strand:+ start:54 stop:443 length:390 start_codon:yes stop_codon:yes gene_type:complete
MSWKEIIKAPSEKIKRRGEEYIKGVNSDVFEKTVLEQIESLAEGLEFHVEKLEDLIRRVEEKPKKYEEDENDIQNAKMTLRMYKITISDLENMKKPVKKLVKDLEEAEDYYEDLYYEDGTAGRKKPPHY